MKHFIDCENLAVFRDPYSSDEEQENMLINDFTPMLHATRSKSRHSLNFTYRSYSSKKMMAEMSATDLLEESLNMFHPDGLPKFFLNFSLKNESLNSFKEVVEVLLRNFLSSEPNKWLMEYFNHDFNETTDIQNLIRKLQQNFQENFETQQKYNVLRPAFHLASRYTTVMGYIKQSRISNGHQRQDHDTPEKKEVIKGLVYEMLNYLEIPLKYSGEEIFHIQKTQNPCRIAPQTVHFKTKPDAFMYVQSAHFQKTIGVVKVHVPSEQTVSKQMIKHEKMISNENVKKTLAPAKLTSERVNSTQQKHNEYTIKTEEKIKLMEDLRELVHLPFQDGAFLTEFCEQLPLEMYTVLQQQMQSPVNQMIKNLTEFVDPIVMGLGLFVVNEYVYLVKITDKMSNLNGFKQDTAEIMFARNFWFNLTHPEHRLALMCFLYNYAIIQNIGNFEEQKIYGKIGHIVQDWSKS